MFTFHATGRWLFMPLLVVLGFGLNPVLAQTEVLSAHFLRHDGSPYVDQLIYLYRDGETTDVARVRTNAEGRADFDVPAGDAYHARVQFHRLWMTSNSVVAGSGQDMVLQTAAVRGSYLKSDGSPFVGSAVRLYRSGFVDFLGTFHADENGAFTLDGVPGASYFMRALVPVGPTNSNTAEAGTDEVMLLQTVSITAEATRGDGSPYQGARLFLLQENSADGSSAITESQGIARYEVFPGMSFRVLFRLQGYQQYSNSVISGEDDVMRVGTTSVRARVLHHDGSPKQGARIYLFTEAGTTAGTLAVTDEQGYASFDVLPLGRYKAYMTALRGGAFSNVVEVGSGEVMLLEMIRIEGRMTYEDGSPFPRAWVGVYNEANVHVGEAYLIDGVVYFDAFPGHSYSFYTDLHKGRGESSRIISGSGEAMLLRVGEIKGVLLDSQGNRVPSIRMWLVKDGALFHPHTTADSEGEARFPVFYGYDYQVAGSVNGTPGFSSQVTSRENLRLIMQTVSVGSQVLGNDGAFVAATVELLDENGTVLTTKNTSAEGAADFEVFAGVPVSIRTRIGAEILGEVPFDTSRLQQGDRLRSLYMRNENDTAYVSLTPFQFGFEEDDDKYRTIRWTLPLTENIRGFRVLRNRNGGFEEAGYVAVDPNNADYLFNDYPQDPSVAEVTYLLELDFGTLSQCEAPTGLSVTNLTTRAAGIQWTGSERHSHYQVAYRQEGAAEWTVTATNTQTTQTLEGLSSGLTYEFRVTGFCDDDVSETSDTVRFTTLQNCGAPSNLWAVNLAVDGALLRWDAVANVSVYTVHWALKGTSAWQTVTVNAVDGNLQSTPITGLERGSEYRFYVTAVCEGGDNPESVQVEFRTLGRDTMPDYTADSIEVDQNGGALYQVPIDLPSDLGEFVPELALTYNSNAPNGILGLGWSLAGISGISRCTPNLTRDGKRDILHYDNRDYFCFNGKTLIPVGVSASGDGFEYRTELQSYVKVESAGSLLGGPASFTATDQDGITHYFGHGAESRALVLDQSAVEAWLLEKSVDRSGNTIHYDYAFEQGNYYISQIRYTTNDAALETRNALHQVVFHYETRGDKMLNFVKGQRVVNERRLAAVEVFRLFQSVRRYDISYASDEPGLPSRVTRLVESNGVGGSYPPIDFEWRGNTQLFDTTYDDPGQDGKTITTAYYDIQHAQRMIRFGDFNGDGINDVYLVRGYPYQAACNSGQILISDGNGGVSDVWNGVGGVATAQSGQYDPMGLTEDAQRLDYLRVGDFNGDGFSDLLLLPGLDESYGFRSGIFLSNGDGTYRHRSHDLLSMPPSHGSMVRAYLDGTHVVDVNGDGRSDVLSFHNRFLNRQLWVDVVLADSEGNLKRDDRLSMPISDAVYRTPDDLFITLARIRVGDFNGDRLMDFSLPHEGQLFLQTPENWQTVAAMFPIEGDDLDSQILSASRYQTGDFNGDGRTDFYHLGDNADTLFLSDGRGGFQTQPGVGVGLDTSSTEFLRRDLARYRFLDVDGNGTTDLYAIHGDPNVGDSVYLFDGLAAFHAAPGFPTRLFLFPEVPEAATVGMGALQFADFTGDGRPDLYYAYGRERQDDLIFTNQYQAPKVTAIRHELGKYYQLDYAWLTDSAVYDKDQPLQNVEEPMMVDHQGNPFQWSDCVVYHDDREAVADRGAVLRVDPDLWQAPFYSVWNGAWRRSNDAYAWENAETLGPAVAAETQTLQVPEHNYPVTYFQGPMEVVSLLRVSDNTGNTRAEAFQYSGAQVHQGGYGFLGFKSMTIDHVGGGTVEQLSFQLTDNQRFGGFKQRHETRVRDSQQLIRLENNLYRFGQEHDGSVFTAYLGEQAVSTMDMETGATIKKKHVAMTRNDFGNLTHAYQTLENPADMSQLVILETTNYWADDAASWPYDLLQAQVTRTWEQTGETHRTVSFSYDDLGRISQESVFHEGLGYEIIQRYSYNFIGNVTSKTLTYSGDNAEERTQTTEYGGRGYYPLAKTNPLGHQTHFQYDFQRGVLTAETDANGLTTHYHYNLNNELIQTTLPSGAVTTTERQSAEFGPFSHLRWGDARTVVTERDLSGRQTAVFYDTLDREVLTVTRGPNGRNILKRYRYDQRGRRSHVSLPYFETPQLLGSGGETPDFEITRFDILDRPIRIEHPDGTLTTYTYDRLGTTINHEGQERFREVDLSGRVRLTRDNLGQELAYHYERDGEGVTHVSRDPAGNETRLQFNARNLPVRISEPNLGVVTFGYNAFGEQVERIDNSGRASTYQYDKLGRITKKSNSDGEAYWHYDEAPNATGRLIEMGGPLMYRTRFQYDAAGRLAHREWDIYERNYGIDYAYDNADRPKVVTYPNGFAVEQGYAENGQLTTIHNHNTGEPVWRLDASNAFNSVTAMTYGNGIDTQLSYAPITNRLSHIASYGAGQQLQDWVYQYDQFGNLTSRQNAVVNSFEAFAFDDLNRLLSVDTTTQLTNHRVDLTYDVLGNILHKSDVGDYHYNGTQPNAVTLAGEKTFAYDGNGNLVERRDGATLDRFAYNVGNKATYFERNIDELRVHFQYNPEGDRFHQRWERGGQIRETDYVDGLFEVQMSGGAALETSYIFAGNRRVAQHQRSSNGTEQMQYLHQDRLGSVTLVTDEAGAVVERLSYDVFGKRRTQDDDVAPSPLFAESTPRGFTDHEMLDDFELVHMNGRVYDPVIARFTTPDDMRQLPLVIDGRNPYSYMLNNPMSGTDPTGHLLSILPTLATLFVAGNPARTLFVLGGGVVGAIAGGIYEHRQGGDWVEGAKKGFTIGISVAFTLLKAHDGYRQWAKRRALKREAKMMNWFKPEEPKKFSLGVKPPKATIDKPNIGQYKEWQPTEAQEEQIYATYNQQKEKEFQEMVSANEYQSHKINAFNSTKHTGNYGTPPDPVPTGQTSVVTQAPPPKVGPMPPPPVQPSLEGTALSGFDALFEEKATNIWDGKDFMDWTGKGVKKAVWEAKDWYRQLNVDGN